MRYLLEGSIRKAAGNIRVSAQLIDATSGAHLWAETYEQPLTAATMFSVQDDITERVVARIGDVRGVISRARFKDSQAKGTDSLDAYECLLRAYEWYVDPQHHLRAETAWNE